MLIIRPVTFPETNHDGMLNLVYSSVAAKPFSRAELLDLLQHAREKNARLGITGILLYKKGSFMQALEGEESAVRALYAAIRTDPRHRQVVTLADLPIAQPRFSDWSMGFENLDEAEPGAFVRDGGVYRLELPPRVEFPWRGSVAMQFLNAFWGPKESASHPA
jgi:hypothetical protein